MPTASGLFHDGTRSSARYRAGLLGPEPERHRRVAEIGQLRVLVGLAGLRDDRVQHPLGVVEDPLLGAAHHPRRVPRTRSPPIAAGPRARSRQLRQLRRAEDRDRREHGAGGRVLDRDRLARRTVGGVAGLLLNVVMTLVQFDRLDRRRLHRPVAGARRRLLDRVDRVHAGGHLPEHGVLAVQPLACSMVTMKNCEPLVLGPALAIASAPRTILWSLISSSNV